MAWASMKASVSGHGACMGPSVSGMGHVSVAAWGKCQWHGACMGPSVSGTGHAWDQVSVAWGMHGTKRLPEHQ